MILAHAAPEQLARLVGTLPEESPVLVHFDKRADAALFDRAAALLGRRVSFVERCRCRWGQFGIVQATLNLIDALRTEGHEFDYATLLSGADYPIKSNAEIAQFLTRNRGAEFIESFSLVRPNRWSDHGGYYKTPEKVLRRHLHLRSRMIRLPGLRTMPRGLEPFGGTQWWTLSRAAIDRIARFLVEVPELVPFARLSFIPDESFIQTIVSNSGLSVSGNCHRLAVWDRPNPPYPATLTIADRELMLSSDCHFARKFSATDTAVLDMLDSRRRGENLDRGVPRAGIEPAT